MPRPRRIRRNTLLCFSILLLLFATQNAQALDPDKRLFQYRHKAWRVQDGVLPNSPQWISQSAEGYLLVGIPSMGSYQFDGIRFVPWQPSTSHVVENILPGKGGGFWLIGPAEVLHVQGQRVLSHFELHGAPIGRAQKSMLEAADGSLWTVLNRHEESSGPLCHVTDLTAHCFGASEGMPYPRANALVSDGSDGFWVGTDQALIHWQPKKVETHELDALASNAGQTGIGSLVRNSDGSLWVGIEKKGPGLGLGIFDGRQFRSFATPTFDGSKLVVNALLMDRDQNLWVAALTGLYRIHGDVVDRFGAADGLSSDTVLELFEDREGILWAATSGGLDSFSDTSITTYSHSAGLAADVVDSVWVSRDGTIWAAEDGALDTIRNGVVSSIRSADGLPGEQVSSLLEDRAGHMWIGVDDGLFLYEQQHFRPVLGRDHQPLGLIVDITEDRDGNIWAECASKPRKLVRIRDLKVQEEFSSSQVAAGHSLAADPNGGIWISTLDGDLLHIHEGEVQRIPLNLSGSLVRQIQSEPDGSVLVAAPEDGLLGIRSGKVQRLTKKNGLPCDGAFGFVRDENKVLWLEAPCGYIAIADPEIQRWWAEPSAVVQFQFFDAFDGARPGRVSFNSAMKSPDGHLWFATQVLQTIDPRHLLVGRHQPPVQIEQVVANHTAYEIDPDAHANLWLPAGTRDIEIDYTALTLMAPEKTLFRYRLKGLDSDWHEVGKRRQALYTNLSPGDYRLLVSASNNGSVWTERDASLDFNIAPSWYQTLWFRLLIAAGLMLVVGMIVRLRVRQVANAMNVRFYERLAERTRIARDLHDTLLQTIQGSKVVADEAMDRPSDSDFLLRAMRQLSDWLGRATEEGRAALNSLRTSMTEKNDLSEALSRAIEERQAQSSIRAALSVVGAPSELHPIVSDEIYRIGYEAIRNAFSHSHATELQVQITYAQELTLRVKDNGVGMDVAVAERGKAGHFGLVGMRERATRIGARLGIVSSSTTGTDVVLQVPGAIVYRKGARQ
jgi:signal transduction histidine kinase